MYDKHNSLFVPFETLNFTLNVGLRSLRGGKIISNFLMYNNNIAVILHFLSGDGWMEKPKLLAENFYSLHKKIMGTELKIYLCFIMYSGSGGGAVD